MSNLLETTDSFSCGLTLSSATNAERVYSLSKTSRLENKPENTNTYTNDSWL